MLTATKRAVPSSACRPVEGTTGAPPDSSDSILHSNTTAPATHVVQDPRLETLYRLIAQLSPSSLDLIHTMANHLGDREGVRVIHTETHGLSLPKEGLDIADAHDDSLVHPISFVQTSLREIREHAPRWVMDRIKAMFSVEAFTHPMGVAIGWGLAQISG